MINPEEVPNPTGLKPILDQVLIKRVVEEEKTEAGIILHHTTTRSKPQRGLVVAVGKGKRLKDGFRAPEVKPGSLVYFGKYKGVEITVDGDEYLMMREEDIIGEISLD